MAEHKHYHLTYSIKVSGRETPYHLKGKVRIKRKNGDKFSLKDAENHLLKTRVTIFGMRKRKAVKIKTNYGELKKVSTSCNSIIYKR